MSSTATMTWSPRQLKLIHDTLARDTNPDEFNLFIETARRLNLDPFRRQILAIVFNKTNAAKRQMSIIVSRDGLRTIAARCGDYRPASEPPSLVYDETLKQPLNPKGIVSATVFLWKQDNKGTWYPVAGSAEWDEYCPVQQEWADGEDGKRYRTGKVFLDPTSNWARMPTVMIAKCAEAAALRAGWPNEFSGVHIEEEFDRARIIDLDASEIVAQEEEQNRLRLAGAAGTLVLFWGDNWALENVPLGQVADRVTEFLRSVDPATAAKWESANRDQLREFWAKAPADALELKKVIEAAKQPKKENGDDETSSRQSDEQSDRQP